MEAHASGEHAESIMESDTEFLARLDEEVRRAHEAIARLHAEAVADLRRAAWAAQAPGARRPPERRH
ncbi:hypothetical protein SAMN05421810_101794 [Amycolatopsis arida]|uniref:Uncharacterized protein n=2 Tax=Amycolatopsis arida TaxID=587909 RepID=A0A1I5M4U2_9PSEU|nr:hypothetical protein CLV69_104426 [Amycolatopsis arida]SFP04549.1 hypothetical protein SAMN05421810_101794 [Amycolatopsis arida]